MDLNNFEDDCLTLNREKILKYLIGRFIKTGGFNKELDDEQILNAYQFSSELNTFSTEKLLEFYDEEEKEALLEQSLIGLENDKYQFFNRPSCKADVYYYLRLKSWTKEQAVALSFGKEPNKVNWGTLSSLSTYSVFVNKYRSLWDMLIGDLDIADVASPKEFLAWFNEQYLFIHRNLQQVAIELSIMEPENYKWMPQNNNLTPYAKENGFSLHDNAYIKKLENYCKLVMEAYPQWSKKRTVIQRTGNLKYFIKTVLPGITAREIDLTIKLLEDFLLY